MQVNLTAADGRPLDRRTLRTGFRSLDVDGWQFRLNGRRLFIRGLNWVPADVFPGRLRRADYDRLLRPLPDQGVNLLRVWGGGLREKAAFYHLCDELGLLVWQEFPFACMFLGSYPRDPGFLSLVETECGDIVRQLRSHPSLALWCGGNEFSRRRNRPLLDTLAAVVARLDETRPFVPTSPGPGDVHEWRVWHGLAPLHTCRRLTAAFVSEFGLQAPPHPDTLSACLPDPATGWDTHHADLPKLTHYAAPFLPACGDLASAARQAQAVGLQLAIETMRRRKGQAGGVCVWQYNEPWPAISWAIVDYFGRPKPAWTGLADWYNPVLVSLDFPPGRAWRPGDWFTADIWAINDTLHPLPDCRLRVEIDGVAVHVQPVDLPADSAVRVGRLEHRLRAAPRQVSLTLHRGDDLLARNRYPLDWSDSRRAPLLLRLRRALADWALK